jgi:capsular exopolysaccharide synthesis family protein
VQPALHVVHAVVVLVEGRIELIAQDGELLVEVAELDLEGPCASGRGGWTPAGPPWLRRGRGSRRVAGGRHIGLAGLDGLEPGLEPVGDGLAERRGVVAAGGKGGVGHHEICHDTPSSKAIRDSVVPLLPVETMSADDDAVDLRAYLQVLQRRWKVVVAVVAVAVVASLALSLSQHKQYRAEAVLLIRQGGSQSLIPDAPTINATEAVRSLNNEVRLFESEAVEKAVEEAYNGPLDPKDVSAAVASDTSDVVKASMTATDGNEAADLVNLYVEKFIEVRRLQRVDELLSVGTEIRSKIDDLTAQIAEVRKPLAAIEERLARAPNDAGLAAQRDTITSQLAPRLTPLESQRAFYQSQLEELDLIADVNQQGGATVVRSAEAPAGPVSPSPVRDTGVALVLGLVLGVGVAFLIDTLDERIRGVADLERVSGGLPTLALIPEMDQGRDNTFVAARDDAQSAGAEAFRSLRTAVKFAAIDHPIEVIQVTSATSGEGKTTAVANLAVALAQGGDRVAVVCCDLRRPTLQTRMGVSLTPGLTDVLLGDVSLDAAVRRHASNIFVLPAGSPPPNPSELLSSDKAAGVIKALAEKVDVVIVDSTPVLPVTDALVVSRLVDATLVVADRRSTDRKAVRRTLQLLAQVNAPVIGLVLNGMPEGGEYGYGYGYGYSQRSEPRSRRQRRAEAADRS